MEQLQKIVISIKIQRPFSYNVVGAVGRDRKGLRTTALSHKPVSLLTCPGVAGRPLMFTKDTNLVKHFGTMACYLYH